MPSPSRLTLPAWAGVALAAAVALGQDSDVIARWGDAVVRRGDLEAVVQRLGLAAATEGQQRQRAEAAILEQLVDDRILRGELDRLGVRATGAEIQASVARLRDQVASRGLVFENFLAASGRTPGDLDKQVALEIALEKFVRPQITADAIAETFDQHRRELDGTRLRVSHIVLRPDAGGPDAAGAGLIDQATAIRQRIVQRRLSFADAARLHSAGPSRHGGGDLGWIGRDGPMAEVFSSQAFKLAKGSVSPPFASSQGVHIVTVTDVEQGRVGIDAVRPRVEKLLAQELVRRLVAEGRRRLPVTITAGVPHFDPVTAHQPLDDRPVIVEPAP